MLNLYPEAVKFLSTLSRCRTWHIGTNSKHAAMAAALHRADLVRIIYNYRSGKRMVLKSVYQLTEKGIEETRAHELAAINAEHPGVQLRRAQPGPV